MGEGQGTEEQRGPLGLAQARAILDSIGDGVFTVDLEWRVSTFNRAAEEITGIARHDALGRYCWEVLKASVCESGCPLRQTMATGRPVANKAVYIVDSGGEQIPVSISAAVLRGDDGQVVGGVETFRDLSAVEALRAELDGRYSFADMVSKNDRMQELFGILPQLAASDSTVLIRGESGTGKEIVARAIHGLSERREQPMVCVNCGALPDTLLQSELFGHKAGAFTDARQDRPGRFAQAAGGTILLDEVGEMSPSLQVALLRVLEEGTCQPLGGTETLRPDVRILAATHQDLRRMVAENRFRQDLYYRINVIQVLLPPLRERREDIPLLVDHFIARFRNLRGKDISGVTPQALALLVSHDYPGNVRELENIIEHAFVLCNGGMIGIAHLPAELNRGAAPAQNESGLTLEQAERMHILHALARHDWQREDAAEELGIHRTTLWRKMRKLGIEPAEATEALDDDAKPHRP
jgi:PAS domain S-box-containing protein